MGYFCERSLAPASLAFLICLAGCNAKPECDSFETRNAVLQTVSSDSHDPLVNYAARNSNANPANAGTETKPASPESAKPLYLLGEKIVTTSTSEDKRTLKCSGAISATVGDTKASKEITFTVQQSPDGKLSVSVDPFQF
jgi:hypothetical protein